jgi:hypothetical protein
MFIKVTLVRIDDKEKEIQVPSLVNIDDIKSFQLDMNINKVNLLYKTYNDIGEESDEIQENIKIIAERLAAAKLYVSEVTQIK